MSRPFTGSAVRSGLRISIDSLISSPSAHARSIVPPSTWSHRGHPAPRPRWQTRRRLRGESPDFGVGVLVGGAEGEIPFV